MKKLFKVLTHRNGRTRETVETLDELVEGFSYTLECGASYQHEKGNRKINREPKTIKSFITNVNNAVNNSAANGWSSTSYSLGEVTPADKAEYLENLKG